MRGESRNLAGIDLGERDLPVPFACTLVDEAHGFRQEFRPRLLCASIERERARQGSGGERHRIE